MLVLAVTNAYLVGLPVLLAGIAFGVWAFSSAEKGDKAVAQTALDLLRVLEAEKAELTEQLRKCRAACAVLQARAKEHDPE